MFTLQGEHGHPAGEELRAANAAGGKWRSQSGRDPRLGAEPGPRGATPGRRLLCRQTWRPAG